MVWLEEPQQPVNHLDFHIQSLVFFHITRVRVEGEQRGVQYMFNPYAPIILKQGSRLTPTSHKHMCIYMGH